MYRVYLNPQYLASRVLVLYLEQVHCSDHGLHGHEDILIHKLDVCPLVLVRVAGAVNDAHLFDEGRFAGFSSP